VYRAALEELSDDQLEHIPRFVALARLVREAEEEAYEKAKRKSA